MGQCKSFYDNKKSNHEKLALPDPSSSSFKYAKDLSNKIIATVLESKGTKILGSIPPVELIKIGINLSHNLTELSHYERKNSLTNAFVLIYNEKFDEYGAAKRFIEEGDYKLYYKTHESY